MERFSWKKQTAFESELCTSALYLETAPSLLESHKYQKAGSYQDKIVFGYGSCSKCACQKFEGNENVCTNCSHNYRDHY